jgi:hypothetical protein
MKQLLDVTRHPPRNLKYLKNQVPEINTILAMDEKVINSLLLLFA